jgi:flagella basal body P-ring formation protein FlgA
MPTRTLIAIATLLPFAAQTATAGVLVAFRDRASVESPLVTLGDVAALHASDPVDAQRLSAVILGPAPADGREGSITFETVRSRLLSAGIDLSEIEFSGPSAVPIAGSKPTPTSETSVPRDVGSREASQIEQVVIQAIRRYLAVQSRGETFEVSTTVTADAARLLASAATRGVDVSGGRAPWSGQQTFVLKVLDAQDRVQEVQVACKVTARPSVLAAKAALPRGHVIGPDDLVWKKATNDAEATCATNPQQLLGYETQQSLRAGEPIPRDAVKMLPLVRSGQFVTVSSRRPGLAVQRVMKAKADGALGEVIAFQTLETHKTVLARVTGLLEADIVDSADPSPKTQIVHAEPVAGPGPPETAVSEKASTVETAAAYMPRVYVNPVRPMSVPITVVDQSK